MGIYMATSLIHIRMDITDLVNCEVPLLLLRKKAVYHRPCHLARIVWT